MEWLNLFSNFQTPNSQLIHETDCIIQELLKNPLNLNSLIDFAQSQPEKNFRQYSAVLINKFIEDYQYPDSFSLFMTILSLVDSEKDQLIKQNFSDCFSSLFHWFVPPKESIFEIIDSHLGEENINLQDSAVLLLFHSVPRFEISILPSLYEKYSNYFLRFIELNGENIQISTIHFTYQFLSQLEFEFDLIYPLFGKILDVFVNVLHNDRDKASQFANWIGKMVKPSINPIFFYESLFKILQLETLPSWAASYVFVPIKKLVKKFPPSDFSLLFQSIFIFSCRSFVDGCCSVQSDSALICSVLPEMKIEDVIPFLTFNSFQESFTSLLILDNLLDFYSEYPTENLVQLCLSVPKEHHAVQEKSLSCLQKLVEISKLDEKNVKKNYNSLSLNTFLSVFQEILNNFGINHEPILIASLKVLHPLLKELEVEENLLMQLFSFLVPLILQENEAFFDAFYAISLLMKSAKRSDFLIEMVPEIIKMFDVSEEINPLFKSHSLLFLSYFYRFSPNSPFSEEIISILFSISKENDISIVDSFFASFCSLCELDSIDELLKFSLAFSSDFLQFVSEEIDTFSRFTSSVLECITFLKKIMVEKIELFREFIPDILPIFSSLIEIDVIPVAISLLKLVLKLVLASLVEPSELFSLFAFIFEEKTPELIEASIKVFKKLSQNLSISSDLVNDFMNNLKIYMNSTEEEDDLDEKFLQEMNCFIQEYQI